jgi:hypothetical protein
LSGIYKFTGATSVSGGTANFQSGGSTGTFSNTGGTVELASGTTFTVSSGGYTQTSGNTYLYGGTLAVTGGTVDIQSGTSLYGPGTINGNLTNEGTVWVGGGGPANGTLSVSGNDTQSSTGTLDINIGGPTAGTQYDKLSISGTASLSGTLNASLVNGYNPPSGTSFMILTYGSESEDFSTKNLNGLSSGSPGATSYTVTR